MKLRQLDYLHEVIRQNFNVSLAAKALYTSQPGVSRQLQDLATELGVDLFRHQGKRLIGLTPVGAEIAEVAAEVIRNMKRIKEIADAYSTGEQGDLVIVATRHAAATRLQDALVRSQSTAPRLRVRVFEEEPGVAAAKLRSGDASLGVLTEPPQRHPDLLYFPIEHWGLLLAVPRDHPIASLPAVSLETLAQYPCCSYEGSARSRQVLDEAFRAAGLKSPVAFSLGSSDKILDYVEAGVGPGIVGASAFVPEQHPNLRAMDVSNLFRSLTTDLVLPRRQQLSKEVYRLIRLLDPTLTRARIEAARSDGESGTAA
jgi:LysR family transcriptional regulator, cys regulon transcriptional activator